MLEKAKLCVERARQLNGASELCAKLLQEILQKTNSADAIRLNALHHFLSHRPTSLWALRQAAILEINLGKLDHAIDKCQRAIRLMSNAFGECFENTNHRQQICAMWAFISEAYRQKGNLQSAVRACRAIVELDATNYTAKLQLIQLHQGMCHYLDAIALGETIERELPDSFDPNAENDGVDGMMPRPLITHFRTLHLLSLVLYISDSEEMRRCHFVKIQLEKLPDIFSRAKVLLDEGENSSSILLHRCLAQAFKIVQSFNQPTLRDCLQSSGLCKTSAEGGWGICSRSELAKCRIRFLMTVLRANRRASDSWNELGLFFETTAIRFSGSNLKKSEYICNLGRIYIVEGNAFRAQHCFIRAVQLNRHCATAWALLSLLYLQLGLNDEALKAMDNAQKISPSMSEAWCSHAIHAELTNHFDTMDLYRHAIVLKPSAFAIQKYCRFLVDFQRRRKCLDEGSMINFDVLKNVFYTCRLDAQFVHALACLAEHFWYLEEAREYICEPKSLEKAPNDDIILARNRERILIKNGESLLTAEQLEHKFPGSGLGKLKALYDEPTPALYERLQKLSPLNELITSLCAGDLSNFCHHYNPKLFPLLATIAIVFGLPIPSAVFSLIESVRPLHRLFDVFPTVFAGYQIDRPQLAPHDEEEMVVRQDHLTENLYALLKQKLVEERTEEKEGEKNCN
uniref:TPR_REGION domain-containing protein n=1 Tax=Globodera pallida TaxID=36090 RepID=A0A183BZH4_GLOPA